MNEDVSRLILLRMDSLDIDEYCKRTTEFRQYCNDIYFWMDWFSMRGINLTEDMLPGTYGEMLQAANKLDITNTVVHSIMENLDNKKLIKIHLIDEVNVPFLYSPLSVSDLLFGITIYYRNNKYFITIQNKHQINVTEEDVYLILLRVLYFDDKFEWEYVFLENRRKRNQKGQFIAQY